MNDMSLFEVTTAKASPSWKRTAVFGHTRHVPHLHAQFGEGDVPRWKKIRSGERILPLVPVT